MGSRKMRNTCWVVLLAAAFPSWASDPTGIGGSFYERKAEGWFWYQEKPEEKEPDNAVTSASTPSSTNSGPSPFSAAWMRENIPKYKDAAWNSDTIEAMQAFMYLQRYAMDRAQSFAERAEMAVMGDWSLDETIRRPEASFASREVDLQAGAAKQQLVKNLAGKLGLFFFFKSDCQHSQLQATTLKMLQQRTDFTIIPISLDGGNLGADIFSEYKIDTGHAKKMGVKAAPALFLVSEQGDFSSLGYGVMSLQELEHRLLIAARRKNWITLQEFDSTRPILNVQRPLQQLSPTPQDKLPIPPSELVKHLRSISP